MSLSAEDWAKVGAEIRAQAAARGVTVERYLLETICWVLDEREAPPVKMLFKPNDVQRAFMGQMWFWNVILKARQQGMSALNALLVFIFALTHENYRAAIIDRTDIEAKKKLAKIKFAYDNLGLTPLGAAFAQTIVTVNPTNDHTITFSNGSQIYAATSLRGGTINFLWISELGKIAMDDKQKAEEIMGGSLEAVHPGNIIVIESTHEGGRVGENYRMIRLAQKSPPAGQRTQMQWAFHFFGWWQNPRYALELPNGRALALTAEQVKYFAELEKQCGVVLTDAQKNWYVQKAATQRDMARQYPGTPEEALRAISEGAIYADIISKLRSQGRVCDLVCDKTSPLFTSWDLGQSDATGIWLLQVVGPDIHALDYHSGNGMTPDEHAAQVLRWEKHYARPIAAHYLPHDAHQAKAGTTWKVELEKAGLRNLKVVPRIPDVWVGISQTRQLLPRMRFNAGPCEKEFPMDGDRVWPSGLGALEGYRKKISAEGGAEKAIPVHDECEAGASALRTFCEAHAKGMLVGPTAMEVESRRAAAGKQTAKTGLRGRELFAPQRALTGLRR